MKGAADSMSDAQLAVLADLRGWLEGETSFAPLAAGLRVQAGLVDLAAAGGDYHFDVKPRWPLAELA